MLPIVLASVLIAGGKNIWLAIILYVIVSAQFFCNDKSNCLLEDCCSFIKTERILIKSWFLDCLHSISVFHSLSPQPLGAAAHLLNP